MESDPGENVSQIQLIHKNTTLVRRNVSLHRCMDRNRQLKARLTRLTPASRRVSGPVESPVFSHGCPPVSGRLRSVLTVDYRSGEDGAENPAEKALNAQVVVCFGVSMMRHNGPQVKAERFIMVDDDNAHLYVNIRGSVAG